MGTEAERIVALVGPRACGKTSVGRELARRLGWPFVDLDEEVARAYADLQGDRPGDGHESVEVPPAGTVLAEAGEPAFREIEARALESVLRRPGPLVLATGGGVVERAGSRDLLARRTICVWLRVGITELERRLRADPTPRPSLTGADPIEEAGAVLARREPLYAGVASFVLDCRGLGVGEIAEEVAFHLGRGTSRSCRG